jgi:hypothetical protein
MRRLMSLFGPLMLAALLATAGCSSSSPSKTNGGTPGTGVSPATTASAGVTQPSAPPCTIPQNNGGDHDSDNIGGPSDGDGCDK